ncbi:hypothetical protein [Pseudonocardia adelaidensis]|uniref:Uncharacterized protein n=1 Tax=Pseudonocardia adelaidensis TaxID=648754 RepID=A0ABP9NF88_9PSEU
MEQHVDFPWYPLPEDATVQLVAIERRAVRRYPTGPPTKPAHVVWGVLIRRDPTGYERFDLPVEVIRALARDGGARIRPMIEIVASRLNDAVARAITPSGRRGDDARSAVR